jgi:hypothetical protein
MCEPPGTGNHHGRASNKEDAMPRGSSAKRERQYEHIKESESERGRSAGTATRIAAATVNKQRAQSGEARTSGGGGAAGRSKEQLYAEAKRRNIRGRSSMTKEQLREALSNR